MEIHSPDDLIAQEIRERGLSFAPSQKIMEELEKHGAGPATLSAVRQRMPVGTLEIQSPPGSQITLDGVEKGLTDAQGRLVLPDLIAGPHQLSVRKAGFKTGEFNVILAAKEFKHFPVTLAWAGGYLTVRVDPADALIEVASLGQYKDTVSELQCPAGTYDVKVSHAGMKTESRSVAIASGQHATVQIHLARDPQYVQNQLSEAKVKLANGDAQGAIQISKDLTSFEPKNPDVSSLLADAYLRIHDLASFQTAAESAIENGGTITLELRHEHYELSGESIHPATLALTAKTIRYDSMGALCKYHTFASPISDIELAEVTNKSTSGIFVVRQLTPGTFLLHLEIGEAGKHAKRMTLYFATQDSQIVRQNNISFLSSPSTSSDVLNTFVQIIQATKKSTDSK